MILIVSAPGGHLTVAQELFEDCPDSFEYQFVVSSKKNPAINDANFIYIAESNRDWRFFLQLAQSLKIIHKLKPKAIVSTGAGIAIPFFVWAKVLRIRTVFIESASRVNSLSCSGWLAYRVVDRFYIRNKSLASKYPRAIYCE